MSKIDIEVLTNIVKNQIEIIPFVTFEMQSFFKEDNPKTLMIH